MILYHGSYMVVKEPNLNFSARGKDFGPAFYLTPIKEQAERMALRKKIIMKSNEAIVNIFEWNEKIDGLIYKNFEKANEEWLDLIVNCRSNPKYKHNYDIVEGKIADDSVGVTVLLFMSNVITKEQTLERIKYQEINSQIAFCSDKALKELKFLESYEVK